LNVAKRQPDNRYIAAENEVEERLVLRKALYQSPGTTEHRGPTPRARASEAKMPGKSARAESKAAEKAAEERNARPMSADDLFAMLDKEVAAKERAKTTAKQRIGYGREDFRWRVDRESGEVAYVKYTDASGATWEDV